MNPILESDLAQETAVHPLSRTHRYSKVLRGEVKGLGKGGLFTKSKPAVSIEEGSVGVIKGNAMGRVEQISRPVCASTLETLMVTT